MNDPMLSVVVPSYGGAERLPFLLSTLRAQRHDGDWEVIVVLDGVIDASPAVLESVDDLPLRVVELDENQGRPAALNAGFAVARGEVLIRCDDDLGLAPTYLARHAAAHRAPEPVGVVGLCHDVLADSAYARVYGRPANRRIRDDAYALPPERWWKYWAANCSVDRATFESVGGYDTDFRGYGWEDVDWGYRLHLLGVPVILEPRLEVTHLAAASDVAIRVRRAFLGGRARARFEHKHGIEPERVAARGIAPRVWQGLVASLAQVGSPARFEAWGKTLDVRLDRLGDSVGARAVALLVEAAAVAGHAEAAAELGT